MRSRRQSRIVVSCVLRCSVAGDDCWRCRIDANVNLNKSDNCIYEICMRQERSSSDGIRSSSRSKTQSLCQWHISWGGSCRSRCHKTCAPLMLASTERQCEPLRECFRHIDRARVCVCVSHAADGKMLFSANDEAAEWWQALVFVIIPPPRPPSLPFSFIVTNGVEKKKRREMNRKVAKIAAQFQCKSPARLRRPRHSITHAQQYAVTCVRNEC